MYKSELLTKIDEKMKEITVVQNENVGNLDELKAKMLPILEKEFLDSIPKVIERGNKIKIKSLGFELESGGSQTYHIEIDGLSMKVGNWLKGVKVLSEELTKELSTTVNREVKWFVENDKLKFYFYW